MHPENKTCKRFTKNRPAYLSKKRKNQIKTRRTESPNVSIDLNWCADKFGQYPI